MVLLPLLCGPQGCLNLVRACVCLRTKKTIFGQVLLSRLLPIQLSYMLR